MQQAWLTPPHSTFCAICLHSALFVCTQLIFNALRSVCRGDIPALLSALPTLCLHYLHFCLHYLHFCLHYLHHLHTVATKPNSIRDAFAGHRESRFSVAPTSFTPSLYPPFLVGTTYNMLVYVRQCRRSASSVGSADKSVGTLHLHTLRNALKIN